MKASKILSLVLIPGVFGLSLGICSTISQKESIRANEEKVIEIINTSTNMEFLIRAQKALEIRKYDLNNANHDQVPIIMPARTFKAKLREKQASDASCKCPKC